MLETEAAETVDTATVEAEPTKGETTTEDEPLGEGGKKALVAERQLRSAAEKQLRAAQAKLQEIEDAGKTEMQRLAERAERAEQEAKTATLQSLRLEVAASKGLSATQAARLVGSTKDELLADADAFLAEIQPTASGMRIEPPTTAASASGNDMAKLFFGV